MKRPVAKPSSSLLSAVLEAAFDATIVVDAYGAIMFANPSAERLLGWRSADLEGKPLETLIPIRFREGYGERFARYVNGDSKAPSLQRELFALRSDSTEVAVEVTSSLARADDTALCVFAIRDISQLRGSQEALSRSEGRFRAIVERATDSVVIIDEAGKITYYSGADREDSERMQPGMMLEADSFSIVHPDDLDHARAALRETRRNPGVSIPVEVRASRSGGGWRYLVGSVTNLLDDPAVAGIVYHYRDLTEQKAAEEGKERSLAMLEAASDIVSTADSSGRLLYANQATRRLLGMGPDDDLARWTIRDFIAPRGRSRQRYLWQDVLRKGPWRGISTLKSHDGSTVLVSLSAFAHQSRIDNEPVVSIIGRDITQQKLLEDRLNYLASHDSLTELPNRYTFQANLEDYIAESGASSEAAILFMDIDHFKYVNDRLGHQAGDEVLKSFGHIIKSHVRRKDIVARLSGDEFVVLLPDTDPEAANGTARRILHAIRKLNLDAGCRITASIGVATFPRDATNANDLLISSDIAMYRAKQKGGDRIQFDSDRGASSGAAAPARLREEDIRHALDQGFFALYCQPLIDLRRGDWHHYEVLLRMLDQHGNIIAPDDFLPLAERFGMSAQLDRWVVGQALELIRREAIMGRKVRLDVNLTAGAFSDKELAKMLRQELTSGGIDPSCLGFEITETAVIRDMDQAVRFIRSMRSLGCHFSLDDFGVGFSSYYYLKHLPVDYLKIDGAFIRGLADDVIDQQLVRAISEMARGLGKKTVAEAVEDGAALALLQQYGVDYAQGYYIQRPGPAEKILAMPEAAPSAGAARRKIQRLIGEAIS